VLEGQYSEAPLDKVSGAIKETLVGVLGIPPEGTSSSTFTLLPWGRFLHAPYPGSGGGVLAFKKAEASKVN
jgi:hypothetical protein